MKSTAHGLAGDELAALRNLAERGHCVVVFTPENCAAPNLATSRPG